MRTLFYLNYKIVLLNINIVVYKYLTVFNNTIL